MWRLPCSDKDPPIEEKDEELRMRGNEECGAYRAVTKILTERRRMSGSRVEECAAYRAVTMILH